ncbi:MAG: vWA domain-containing protein [Spirochaetaceae bacterium]
MRAVPPAEGEEEFEIAVDATLRARAADPEANPAGAAAWRKKLRRRPGGRLVVFLVDASESMAGRYQLRAAREAAVGLLRSDKTGHDRVAIVSFQDRGARVLLNPTRSSVRAAQALTEVTAAGSTPLAAGLAEAARVMRFDEMRSGQTARVLVILSDGRGNVPLREGGSAARDVASTAAEVRRAATRVFVVDTAPAEERHEDMRRLAEQLEGSYHWIGGA